MIVFNKIYVNYIKRNRKEVIMSHLISFVGSAGSGKSTLINTLFQQKYLTFETVNRKTSRSILADWNKTLNEVNQDVELFKKFQIEMINRKYNDDIALLNSNSNNIIVTERTFADLYSFALMILGHDNNNKSWLQEYYEMCKEKQQIYNTVFLLPYGHFPIHHDDIRPTNDHFNLMWSLLIEYFIKDFNMNNTYNIHNITCTNLIERCEFVVNYVHS